MNIGKVVRTGISIPKAIPVEPLPPPEPQEKEPVKVG